MISSYWIWSALGFAFLVLVLGPLVLFVREGRHTRLEARVTIEIRASLARCSSYIRDPKNLHDYEQKVRSCTVDQTPEGGSTYTCRGWFFGIPWRATFDMNHTADGGFRSEVIKGKLKTLNGGFTLETGSVENQPPRTLMTHWEAYWWPVWFPLVWIIRPLMRRWLRRSLEVEMGVIRDSIELLEREDASSSYFRAQHEDSSDTYRASRYGVRSYLRELLLGKVT